VKARRGSAVLGVAVSVDAVRALVLREERVVWAREVRVTAEQSLEESLRAAMADAPGPRWRRLPVAVAVGPAHAQLRHLRDLPAVRDARTLDAIVQQSAGRYFRQNGTPMITTPLAGREVDAAWAAAIEAPVVRAVLDACRHERLRAVALMPSAAVLGRAAPDGHFTWLDGEVALELRYAAGELLECRCLPSRLAHLSPLDHSALDPALLAMGDDAARFTDAYAAARAGPANGFALRPDRAASAGEPSTARLAIAGAACVASLLLMSLAPALLAARQERIATHRLAALSPAAAPALAAQRTLADSTRMLAELVHFQRASPSVTLLLASLTRAIRKPTMLSSLRLDTDGGTLTALAPSAASLLAMLEEVPWIAAPTISGSVTSENQVTVAPPQPMTGLSVAQPAVPQGRAMERVSVRFHWEGERRIPARSPSGAP
jgi:hypothetical protein